MQFDSGILKQSLAKSEQVIGDYSLPKWEDLTPVDLYMDQVIALLNQYLTQDDDKEVTPSMINNYVKMGLILPPNRKKYGKIQIACLLIICSLKATLEIASIQRLLPDVKDEQEVKLAYNSFVTSRQNAKEACVKYIHKLESDPQNNDYMMQFAVYSSLLKRFAQKTMDIYFEEIKINQEESKKSSNEEN